MARRYNLQFPPPYVSRRKPGQRRKDHGARKRDAEWRAYQGAWMKPINEMRCTAEDFHHVRRNVLVLNRAQTARVLRTSVSSILNWELGTHPVPFHAYLALVMISESLHFKLENEQWRDWRFEAWYNHAPGLPARERKNTAYLVHRASGACFSSADLLQIHTQMVRLAAIESEAIELRGKVGELTAENTSLRELFRVDGVTEEVNAMRSRLDQLLGSINTAQIVRLRAVAGGK